MKEPLEKQKNAMYLIFMVSFYLTIIFACLSIISIGMPQFWIFSSFFLLFAIILIVVCIEAKERFVKGVKK